MLFTGIHNTIRAEKWMYQSAIASNKFINRYEQDFKELSFFNNNSDMRNYYLDMATIQGSMSPMIAIALDVSFITLISAHAKVVFAEKDNVTRLTFCKSVLLTGAHGTRKSIAINAHQQRIFQFFNKIKSSFKDYKYKQKRFRVSLLTSGYIRHIQKQIEWIIPETIVQLCYKAYCGYYLSEFKNERPETNFINRLKRSTVKKGIYDFTFNHTIQEQVQYHVHLHIYFSRTFSYI